MLKVCGSSLLWRFLPVGGVGLVVCQGFLVREACVSVPVCVFLWILPVLKKKKNSSDHLQLIIFVSL